VSGPGAGYRPTKFLDRLEGSRHWVMLYDDQRRADFLVARYFLNGLEAGGSCVLFMDEEHAAVKKRLMTMGVDAGRYEKDNRLRVLGNAGSDSRSADVMEALKAMTRESTKGMKPPFRFAGRTVPDIETIDGMRQGIDQEKIGNDHFDEFGISLLCLYDIRKMEPSRRDEWVRGLLENHHSAIYASEPDKAVGFETCLLEEEE
jgi:hypothetical protein